ncbi:hypothetical protein DM819_03015 [Pseudomonas hunanensis]|uniref:Uncharacterized protein n=1 Tax=Pseudomonas hunanensis TaxID=1247546 RepID=A0ABD6MUR4_9PSED|nr:hypothetical protein [Pseudomonas hunanensis]PTV53784.1 hypothetical protein DBL05_23225 [Pseudomonas putida]
MGRACWPISTRGSPLPPPPYSRVNPLLQGLRKPQVYGAVVGAGLPANGPQSGPQQFRSPR